MAKRIPKSLWDAVREDPGRFTAYLDIDKIVGAANPYDEFIAQMSAKFGKRQGLNLWQYLDGQYSILNFLYKSDKIQEKLPKEFKGPLSKKETVAVMEKLTKRKIREIEKIMERVMPDPTPLKYTPRMLSFIKSRKGYRSNRLLSYEFYRAFRIMKSANALGKIKRKFR